MGQQQIAADICAAFAPLFDSGIGLDGFALPVRADQLPRGIAAELAAAGLVDANGAPVALVAPPEPERPRPQRVPVLRCSNAGPQMTQLPPLRSLSMQLNGRPVEKV
jgi:hypothetical protein